MNIIDTFRYLVSLEEHKHFSRAAQACHITQPALSNALKSLEEEMGVKIVNRGRNYEGLTAEGKQVLASAYQVLHEIGKLKSEINSQKSAPIGNLIIGSIPSTLPVASQFAASIFAEFNGLKPTVRSMTSHDLDLCLENLSVDVAFGYTERPFVNTQELRVIPQYEEKYFFINKNTSSNTFGPISWKEAARSKLSLLTPEMHNRKLIDVFFKKNNVDIEPVMQTDSIFSLLLSVQSSDLATILSGPTAKFAKTNHELSVRELTDPAESTAIGIMIPSSNRLSIVQHAVEEFASSDKWTKILIDISMP